MFVYLSGGLGFDYFCLLFVLGFDLSLDDSLCVFCCLFDYFGLYEFIC